MNYTLKIGLKKKDDWRNERQEISDFFRKKNIKYKYQPDGNPYYTFDVECEEEDLTIIGLCYYILKVETI